MINISIWGDLFLPLEKNLINIYWHFKGSVRFWAQEAALGIFLGLVLHPAWPWRPSQARPFTDFLLNFFVNICHYFSLSSPSQAQLIGKRGITSRHQGVFGFFWIFVLWLRLIKNHKYSAWREKNGFATHFDHFCCQSATMDCSLTKWIVDPGFYPSKSDRPQWTLRA